MLKEVYVWHMGIFKLEVAWVSARMPEIEMRLLHGYLISLGYLLYLALIQGSVQGKVEA